MVLIPFAPAAIVLMASAAVAPVVALARPVILADIAALAIKLLIISTQTVAPVRKNVTQLVIVTSSTAKAVLMALIVTAIIALMPIAVPPPAVQTAVTLPPINSHLIPVQQVNVLPEQLLPVLAI